MADHPFEAFAERQRIGAPIKPDARRLLFTLRIDPQEREALREAAADVGLSMAEYVRVRTFGHGAASANDKTAVAAVAMKALTPGVQALMEEQREAVQQLRREVAAAAGKLDLLLDALDAVSRRA